MTINIVFPVLNEDHRLKKGIAETVRFLDNHPQINYRITIVDNGSDAEHQRIAEETAKQYEKASCIRIEEKGVGGAFQAAIKVNTSDVIGYMDVDLSTHPKYLLDVLDKFGSQKTNIVNASRLLKLSQVKDRSFIREITSRGLNVLLHLVFKVTFTDAMCGFKFFRQEAIMEISDRASNDNSWFYCAELLIWAEKLGYSVCEIPVEWNDDANTKVKIVKLIKQYLLRILRIYKDLQKYKIIHL